MPVYNITEEIRKKLNDNEEALELDPVSLEVLGLYVSGSHISSNDIRQDLSHISRKKDIPLDR